MDQCQGQQSTGGLSSVRLVSTRSWGQNECIRAVNRTISTVCIRSRVRGLVDNKYAIVSRGQMAIETVRSCDTLTLRRRNDVDHG